MCFECKLYRKNAQNDIIALLDNNGNVVVKYAYDAWGVCGDQTYKEFKKGVAKKPHQSGKDLIFKKIYLVKK